MRVVVSLVVFFSILRFVGLDRSPPGFYLDEAAISARIVCLADSGGDFEGRKFPLFSEVLGGGYATPPMLYFGAAWTSVFGDSIASFRSFTAFFGVLFVVASYFFALRLWRSKEAAWLAALCAAISPWAFQFSRISWDPGLAPAFVTGALALALAEGERFRRQAVFAGLLFALAAYSYPPIRVQLALVIPFLFVVEFVRDRARAKAKLLPLMLSTVVASIPLIVLTLRGDIQGRFRMLSVFNEGYLSQLGKPTLLLGLEHFFMNLATHFSPSYLFLRGDGNPRHSTFAWGEWSALEMTALVLAIFFLVRHLLAKKKVPVKLAISFALFGYLAGVIPAALTWESNPHALRSIGALAFSSVAAGGVLALAWRMHVAARVAIVVIAISFGAYYYSNYFSKYPQWAGLYFDQVAVETIERLAKEGRLDPATVKQTIELKDYPDLALAYFQQAHGLMKCR